MWLSIIIPIYNAEKYLSRCIDSVIRAAVKANEKLRSNLKIEIILINNNSTDDSPKIIKKYEEKYPEIIKIYDYEKPGAAAVRNFGAKKARGDYLWFIDADDYVAPDSLLRLYETTTGDFDNKNHKPDLIMIGAQKINRDGQAGRHLSAVTPEEQNYRHRFVRYGMGPWQVVISRNWWQKHNFSFREGIIHEDMELMSSLILHAKNYTAIDKPLYYYCDNPDSVLHKAEFNPKIFDIFPALEGLYNKFHEENAVNTYRDDLEWFFVWNLLIDSARDFRNFRTVGGRPGFSRSRKMLREYFPKWRRNRYLRQKSLLFRIRCQLAYWGV